MSVSLGFRRDHLAIAPIFVVRLCHDQSGIMAQNLLKKDPKSDMAQGRVLGIQEEFPSFNCGRSNRPLCWMRSRRSQEWRQNKAWDCSRRGKVTNLHSFSLFSLLKVFGFEIVYVISKQNRPDMQIKDSAKDHMPDELATELRIISSGSTWGYSLCQL